MELKCFFYCLDNKSLSSKLLVEASLLKPARDYKTFHNIVKLMTAHYDIMTLWHYGTVTYDITNHYPPQCMSRWTKEQFQDFKNCKGSKKCFLESKWFLKDIVASLFGQTVNQKTQHIRLIFQSTLYGRSGYYYRFWRIYKAQAIQKIYPVVPLSVRRFTKPELIELRWIVYIDTIQINLSTFYHQVLTLKA